MFNFLSGGRARTSNRTRRSRQPAKRQATLEFLENRTLLSNVTAVVNTSSVLTITSDTPKAPVAIAIVENSNGTVTVTGVSDTTVNDVARETFGTPLASLDVNFGNSTADDLVLLNGSSSPPPYAPPITNVTIALGTGGTTVVIGTDYPLEPGAPPANGYGISVSNLTITSNDSGKAQTYVEVDNSKISGTLSVTLGGGQYDQVVLGFQGGNRIATTIVSEGSGSQDSISSDSNTYGAKVTFTQGDGGDYFLSYDDIQAEGSFTIGQGAGDGDFAEIYEVSIGKDLNITQGDGTGDQVLVDDTTIGGAANITQGDGNSDFVEVASYSSVTVGGNLTIDVNGAYNRIELGSPTTTLTVGGELNVYSGLGGDSVYVDNTTASSSSFTDVALAYHGSSTLYDSGGNSVPFDPEPIGLVGVFNYIYTG